MLCSSYLNMLDLWVKFSLVSGFALNKGIHLDYTQAANSVCTVSSQNFPGQHSFDLHNIPERQRDWADHLRGTAISLSRHNHLTKGISATIRGELPIGGLSSSAAVIIAFLTALSNVNDIQLSPSKLIDAALWAENGYVGVSCGKLDQSCEVYRQKDHLLFLDTKDDSYQ
ncbi:hypothetical protein FACS1894184_15820 [Clostridia bacterium]|nr:hypothetical protein FACS1894184_15820 [Clostridia bacterium]